MSTPPRGKLALPELGAMKRRGEKIVMVTAYDAPGARFAEDAGVDVILVGDTAAMVVLGHEGTTVPVTMDEMLFLTRAVARGARRPVVIGDMPFGSYQVSDEDALRNAIRFVKEAGADAVKLEGAGPSLSRVRTIVEAGIPVMGHVGLTPQSATMLGGFKTQGKTADAAQVLVEAALALEEAGCFSVVLEAVPSPVAAEVTSRLSVPTIGIGAGPDCDGQVLVYHDLLGLTEGHLPRFVKRYANLSREIRDAIEAYAADVRAGTFPDAEHAYAMDEEERERFELDRSASNAAWRLSREPRCSRDLRSGEPSGSLFALSVLIADDHDLFAEALTMTLQLDERLEVVARARDGREAIDLASSLQPDVVLMDLHMPVLNGIEATREVRRAAQGSRVVIVTSSTSADDERRGARGRRERLRAQGRFRRRALRRDLQRIACSPSSTATRSAASPAARTTVATARASDQPCTARVPMTSSATDQTPNARARTSKTVSPAPESSPPERNTSPP